MFTAETRIIPVGYILDITISYTRAFNTNSEEEGYLFEPRVRLILTSSIKDL